MRERLAKPFQWKTWHLLAACLVVGTLCSASLLATLIFGSAVVQQGRELNEAQDAQIRANEVDAQQAKDLARALAPSDEDLAAGAAHALEVCLATPSCRLAFRDSVRKAKLRPEDVPNLVPQGDTTPNGNGSGSGGGSGRNPSGSSGTGQGSDTTGPTSRQPPANRPRRPAPAPPSGPAPSVPVPSPSAPGPAPKPPATSTPPPVVTPPTIPTIPPVQPPTVTVPGVPVRVCTPVIQVNCVDPKNGRVVGPEGHAADPNSNSGRGNESEPLCERIKAPCDDDGNPVFPTGLIRLP